MRRGTTVISLPAPGVISQSEIAHWFALSNQIASLLAMQNQLELDVLERMNAGHEVEPGPHTVVVTIERANGREIRGVTFR